MFICEEVPSCSKSLEPRRGRVGVGWGDEEGVVGGEGYWVVVERKRKSGVSSVGSSWSVGVGVGWRRVSSSWSAIFFRWPCWFFFFFFKLR